MRERWRHNCPVELAKGIGIRQLRLGVVDHAPPLSAPRRDAQMQTDYSL